MWTLCTTIALILEEHKLSNVIKKKMQIKEIR